MQLLTNGYFYSLNKNNDIYKAILIDRDKIVDCFFNIPTISDVEQIDLHNKFIFPGFIDAHTHFVETGILSLGADLSLTNTVNDAIQLLKMTKPIDGIIIGYNFDQYNYDEKREFTYKELNSVSKTTPLFILRKDGHSCYLNEIAFNLLKLNPKTVGIITKNNKFCGILRGQANSIASKFFKSQIKNDGKIIAFYKAAELAINKGVTTVHAMLGDAKNDLSDLLLYENIKNELHIKIIPYPQVFDIEKVAKLGYNLIGGCLLVDGSFGSHTAALMSSYADSPGNGVLYHSDSFWYNFFMNAEKKHIRVAVHSIGDRAILQILNAIEMAKQKHSKSNLQHIIIHFELTPDYILDKARELDVQLVMQPVFEYIWGGKGKMYEQVLGKERIMQTNRFRSILQRGLLVAGSSDAYVTPIDPLLGIYSAVNHPNPDEKISKLEALRMFTTNAAEVSGDENNLGKIDKEYIANLVVLAENPLATERIDKIKIEQVFINGMGLVLRGV